MRAAPAFELPVALSRGERCMLALIGATCTGVIAAWLWSHVDAAAGPAGRGVLPAFGAIATAALLGAWLGWRQSPRHAGTLAWHQGNWTLRRVVGPPCEGQVQAKIDLGSWLLLRFEPIDGTGPTWFGVDRARAGAAWHALRATLFAPGALDDASRRSDEGASP
jgi:hypothetical protein